MQINNQTYEESLLSQSGSNANNGMYKKVAAAAVVSVMAYGLMGSNSIPQVQTEEIQNLADSNDTNDCSILGVNMSCPKPQRCALTAEQEIPMKWQRGFCVDSKGGDVNDGVKKLSSSDVRTPAEQKACLDLCTADSMMNSASQPPLSACEGITSQGNRGCYAHYSSRPARGNGASNHFCAIQTQSFRFNQGFCVDRNGGDVNSGVTQLSKDNVNTVAEQNACLYKCTEYASNNSVTMTGCEGITDQGNRGCYIHTSRMVDHANGAGKHLCATSAPRQFVTKVACV